MYRSNNGKVEVFISYAHEDEKLRNELEKHLKLLERNNIISTWHNKKIVAGSESDKEIDKHLHSSQVILLLISSDFIASDYCYSSEMDTAIELHYNDEAMVIPIMLRAVDDWKSTPFGKLEVLPQNAVPITLWDNSDEAFSNVVKGIRERIQIFVSENNTRHEKKIVNNISEKYNRNRNFEGRKKTLEDIRNYLNQSESTVMTQAIVGLGGIGKTQIAIEYAYRCINEYNVIWWINADSPALLASEYSNLAKKLGYTDQNLKQEVLVKLAKEWLENNNNWLLIFDNASEVSDLLEYIPQISNGHVIITSRNPNWSEIGEEIPIDVLGEDEAVNFLLKRSGQSDIQEARKLSEELGYLPLALEQAAAYIRNKGKSISGYLELFHTYQIKMFDDSIKQSSYKDTVSTTWKISFENIKSTFPEALDILNILAFLYSSDIPIDLIQKGVKFLSDECKKALSNELKFDDAIGELLKYSLICVTNDSISIHRLVQSVIRVNLSEEDKKYWIGISFKAINDKFVFNRQIIEERTKVEKIYPHVQNVLSYIKEYNIISNNILDLFGRVGVYLYEKAMYNESLLYLKDIIERRQYKDILDEEEIIYIHSFIGQIYVTLDDNSNAIKYLTKALIMSNKSKEKRYNSIATTLSYIGVVYENLNNLEEALKYNRQAYDLLEKHLNQNTQEAVVIKYNLARISYELGNYKDSKDYYEDILKIEQVEILPDKQDYAAMLSNYAFLLGKFGEYDKAISIIEQALTIDKEIYIKDHPSIARELNNYGYLLKDLNRFDEAEIKLKESIRINRQIFGEKNIKVATPLSNLGMVMRALGKFDEARELCKESLEINCVYYGENHSEVAINYSNLGSLEVSLNNIQEAKKNLKKALKIDRKIYGDEHIEIATDLYKIAEVLFIEEKFAVAGKIVEKALSIDMKYNDGNYINISRDLDFLAKVSYKENKIENAQKFTKKALYIYRKLYSNNHEIIWNTNMTYAFFCSCDNKKDEALEYYIKAVKGFECFKEKYIKELLTCLSEICIIFESKKEMQKLEFYLNKSLELCNIADGHRIDNILMNIYVLAGDFYFERMDYKGALDYYKKALKSAKESNQVEHFDVVAISDKIMGTMNKM